MPLFFGLDEGAEKEEEVKKQTTFFCSFKTHSLLLSLSLSFFLADPDDDATTCACQRLIMFTSCQSASNQVKG